MNKPVAWMLTLPDGTHDWILNGNGCEGYIPLYTHPVSKAKDRFSNYESICLQCGTTIYKPFKELTDEEILQVMMNVYSDTVPPIRGIEFAKAILRKAQDK